MKIVITFLSIALLSVSCKQQNTSAANQQENASVDEKDSAPEFKNEAHKMVHSMVEKTGTYADLLEKNDVVYTYTYTMPDGKEDISTEKYLFKEQLSYGKYAKHERTFPKLSGDLEQVYNGEEYKMKAGDSLIQDPKMIKMVTFKRNTNFYWFTMFQKLLDDGVNYEMIPSTNEGDANYNIVKITFESDKPSDTYQIYINKETQLIDQFLFTVIDFGKTDPMLMKVAYEEIDGILIPATRKYQQSNWQAEIMGDDWINVLWTDIKFNNQLTEKDFQI